MAFDNMALVYASEAVDLCSWLGNAHGLSSFTTAVPLRTSSLALHGDEQQARESSPVF